MAAALATAYQLPPEEPNGSPEGQMALLEHLDELRKRVLHCVIAIGIGILVAFAFIDSLVNFVLAPTRRMLPPGVKLVYTQPGEAFALYVQVALIAGIVLAAPFIMWQVWLFIAPGLYVHEKRFAIPFVFLSTAGFIGGALFSHYIVFPYMIAFFGTFNSASLGFLPRVEDVFDLYTKMLIGMGIVFQMPTLVFSLARMGLLTAGFLWRNIKYAVLAIFVIAAVATPTSDPFNQMVFALPMLGLYVLSIGIAWMVAPKTVE